MENKFDIGDFVNSQTVQAVTNGLLQREKNRRKKMKITQRELSRKSGVSYASIRRFESTGEISLSSLLKIALALNALADFNSVFKQPYVKNLKDYKV